MTGVLLLVTRELRYAWSVLGDQTRTKTGTRYGELEEKMGKKEDETLTRLPEYLHSRYFPTLSSNGHA